MFTQKNIPFFVIIVLLFGLLKIFFSSADNNTLYFLLKPTSTLVSLITGTSAMYTNTSGFHYEALNIVIEKSCSGYNLCLLFFLSLSFLVIKHFLTTAQKIKYFLFAVSSAWLMTILVNASRIWVSIIIQSLTKNHLPQLQSAIHEGIGVFINLSALLTVYFFVDRYLARLLMKNNEVKNKNRNQ